MDQFALSFAWLIHSIIFCSVIAAYETPTVSNATGEYYIYTEFETESTSSPRTIVCTNSTLCSVECSGELSCAQSTIDASNTSDLIVRCLNRYACRTLTIKSGPTVSADIQCVSPFGGACKDSTYNLAFKVQTLFVSILCDQVDGDNDGSCAGLMVIAPYSKVLYLECAGKRDCLEATIIANGVTLVELRANGERSFASGALDTGGNYGEYDTDRDVIVQCNAKNACDDAGLYTACKKQYEFSLKCANVTYSCNNVNVDCANRGGYYYVDSFANLGCPSTSALNGTCDITWKCGLPRKTTSMVFSVANGRFECENTDCCPWSDYSTMSRPPTNEPTYEPTIEPSVTTAVPTTDPAQSLVVSYTTEALAASSERKLRSDVWWIVLVSIAGAIAVGGFIFYSRRRYRQYSAVRADRETAPETEEDDRDV
eukprot:41534_1